MDQLLSSIDAVETENELIQLYQRYKDQRFAPDGHDIVFCIVISRKKTDLQTVKTLEILLKLNVNINSIDWNKQTPLFYACRDGKISTVKFLSKHLDVNWKDNCSQTAAFYAAREGNLEILKYLYKVGDPGLLDHRDLANQSCLHYACDKSHLEICKFLIQECNVSTNIRDRFGKLPIFYATNKQILQIFKSVPNPVQAAPSVSSGSKKRKSIALLEEPVWVYTVKEILKHMNGVHKIPDLQKYLNKLDQGIYLTYQSFIEELAIIDLNYYYQLAYAVGLHNPSNR
jgi:Ankyrin repeats (3 copies)/Ankyrin repeat